MPLRGARVDSAGLNRERPRLLYVVTHGVTANVLLRGQLRFLRESGYDVHVVGSAGPDLDLVERREGVVVHPIHWTRAGLDPTADLRGLAAITALIAKIRPHIVNASTPKGGLYGSLAAATLRVPVRIYLLRGLRLETTRGVVRRVLGVAESLASRAAHEVICVSESLRRAFVAEGYAPASRTRVLGPGSSNGVDVSRFTLTEERLRAAAAWRRELGVPADAPVIGFVGRLVADKGVDDLLTAFDAVRAVRPDARLLLVGADFGDDVTDPSLRRRLDALSDRAICTPRVDDVAPFFARMDLLVFPSRREGLPNVPIEAASAGIPTVGYRVTGVVDAVDDGAGGTLVEPGDRAGLAAAARRYVEDPVRRRSHGDHASRSVVRFDQRRVHERWLAYYDGWLARRGIAR